ncbi:hypothetical protein ILFOPFJJ_02559 [Ensifer psoraleae]|nr:hypothetical protein [Sinorhizobium psoraleae]
MTLVPSLPVHSGMFLKNHSGQTIHDQYHDQCRRDGGAPDIALD